ncbi:MAG: putative AGC family protein kinase [Streblomastix strix]|uniref:Putative AGC family protein kinase n=1 Tax=Streblomastix strix TaxID=222440 RepID=A0A5J4UNZ7_9EUKA|nr:MAG: putative AGC family protein kinase [Streblomastix strix]
MVHAARLIHRDIKPENIMMHSANGIIKAKLADFGLAKVVQNTLLGVSSYGTPLNMAPELVLRDVPATNKIDMYSVGTVLYQLATHDYPINVNSVPELQKKFAAGPIKRPASMLDDFQWDFLSKLLEFDPNKRLSAEQALLHPYFTSLAEITPEIRQITKNAVATRLAQQKAITEYDKDETFTVPTTEIRKFIKTDPEAEEQTILAQRTQQQVPIYPGQQQTQTVRQQIRPPSPIIKK